MRANSPPAPRPHVLIFSAAGLGLSPRGHENEEEKRKKGKRCEHRCFLPGTYLRYTLDTCPSYFLKLQTRLREVMSLAQGHPDSQRWP